jgi:hypothetical protein
MKNKATNVTARNNKLVVATMNEIIIESINPNFVINGLYCTTNSSPIGVIETSTERNLPFRTVNWLMEWPLSTVKEAITLEKYSSDVH